MKGALDDHVDIQTQSVQRSVHQLVRRLASAKYFAVVPGIRLTFQRLTLRLL